MKINDIVKLVKQTTMHPRGVLDQRYRVVEFKKTEIKLCSEENSDYCFYTCPNNVEPLVKCTIPD